MPRLSVRIGGPLTLDARLPEILAGVDHGDVDAAALVAEVPPHIEGLVLTGNRPACGRNGAAALHARNPRGERERARADLVLDGVELALFLRGDLVPDDRRGVLG